MVGMKRAVQTGVGAVGQVLFVEVQKCFDHMHQHELPVLVAHKLGRPVVGPVAAEDSRVLPFRGRSHSQPCRVPMHCYTPPKLGRTSQTSCNEVSKHPLSIRRQGSFQKSVRILPSLRVV